MKIASLSKYHKFFRWDFVDDETNIIEYIEQLLWLYDSDNCGDHTEFWVVSHNGETKFYKSQHTWWWHNYGEEDSRLENEFTITEIERKDISGKSAIENLRFVV